MNWSMATMLICFVYLFIHRVNYALFFDQWKGDTHDTECTWDRQGVGDYSTTTGGGVNTVKKRCYVKQRNQLQFILLDQCKLQLTSSMYRFYDGLSFYTALVFNSGDGAGSLKSLQCWMEKNRRLFLHYKCSEGFAELTMLQSQVKSRELS